MKKAILKTDNIVIWDTLSMLRFIHELKEIQGEFSKIIDNYTSDPTWNYELGKVIFVKTERPGEYKHVLVESTDYIMTITVIKKGGAQ